MRRLQSFLPGVLKEVFDALRKKADTMEEAEYECVLFLDEMEIAEGIEHEQSQDCFLGSVTYPPRDDAPNCALVFTQGGLTTR